MIYRTHQELLKHHKPGDAIYACHFKYDSTKENNRYIQEPVQGILSQYSDGSSSANTATIHYFIPFRKNTMEPAKSRAVSISARKYADTEAECIELYNSLIHDNIEWHESEIQKLRERLMPKA